MKVEICKKNQDVVLKCDSIKPENGFLVVINPSLENGSTIPEMWIPVGLVTLVNILEK